MILYVGGIPTNIQLSDGDGRCSDLQAYPEFETLHLQGVKQSGYKNFQLRQNLSFFVGTPSENLHDLL